MVNEMEKSGIPTALITNMTAVARSIGSPRALKAVSAEVSGQEFF